MVRIILCCPSAAARCLTQRHFVTDGHSLCADRLCDLLVKGKSSLTTCLLTTGLYYFSFFFHTSINGWGGELKWHLIPLTWSYYSAFYSAIYNASFRKQHVNCSFNDPICTQKIVKSLILLTASPSCGRNALPDLSRSSNQCLFPRPSLQNKSVALSVRVLPLITQAKM